MWINRDISGIIEADKDSYIQILVGPRQCGKSSLLWKLGLDKYEELSFDNIQIRNLAEQDPAFFMSQRKFPLVLDEVQYAPSIFSELKIYVDNLKKINIEKNIVDVSKHRVRLTGSNNILLDKFVKESLAGRIRYYFLNTLSVHEVLSAIKNISITDLMFKGGFPELYKQNSINAINYLNDYIRTYIEKDIVLSAGIIKIKDFNTVLGILASRTGELINFSDIAKDTGVRSVTIKEWLSVLEKMSIISLLKPYYNNLNKRLIKTPKLYFLDTGIACRLQGWSELKPMIQSSQAGHIFETLVFCELFKLIKNFDKNWELFFWQTKEGEEIDFIIKKGDGQFIAIEAKLGVSSVEAKKISYAFYKDFPEIKELIIVSYGGIKQQLSKTCIQVPISELTDFLLKGKKIDNGV